MFQRSDELNSDSGGAIATGSGPPGVWNIWKNLELSSVLWPMPVDVLILVWGPLPAAAAPAVLLLAWFGSSRDVWVGVWEESPLADIVDWGRRGVHVFRQRKVTSSLGETAGQFAGPFGVLCTQNRGAETLGPEHGGTTLSSSAEHREADPSRKPAGLLAGEIRLSRRGHGHAGEAGSAPGQRRRLLKIQLALFLSFVSALLSARAFPAKREEKKRKLRQSARARGVRKTMVHGCR